jgi:hypothetical protein
VAEVADVLPAVAPVGGAIVRVAPNVTLIAAELATVLDPVVPRRVALELACVLAHVAPVLPDVAGVVMDVTRVPSYFAPVLVNLVTVRRGDVLRAGGARASNHQGRGDGGQFECAHRFPQNVFLRFTVSGGATGSTRERAEC